MESKSLGLNFHPSPQTSTPSRVSPLSIEHLFLLSYVYSSLKSQVIILVIVIAEDRLVAFYLFAFWCVILNPGVRFSGYSKFLPLKTVNNS